MTITLKDSADANVVYILRNRSGNSATFAGPNDTLLGTPKLVLSLDERPNTNRIVGKLSIPTVADATSEFRTAEIIYTEVGSFDLSAVKAASATDAAEFYAQFKSLIASDAVREMFLSGTHPQ